MGYRFQDWARVRPVDLRPGDAIALKIVAVVSYGGNWAAYMGRSEWSDEETAERGDKLLKEAAELLFPQFVRAELQYRE